MSIIIGEFKNTGINLIDINLVSSKWNHLCVITEWRSNNTWRLIQYKRKDSPITKTKLTISETQAHQLIEENGLIEINSGFASGFTWRRKKDIEYLEQWRRDKNIRTILNKKTL